MISNTAEKIVIVEKFQSLFDSDKGLVTPIIIYNVETEEMFPVDLNEFPNGKIFISQGYSNIDENFAEGEAFYFNYDAINESTDFSILDSPNKHKFWAFGNQAKNLDKNLLSPIIISALPDMSNGLMPATTSLPDKNFFILEDQYIYGPFQGAMFDSECFAQPINTITHMMLKQYHVAKYLRKNLEKHILHIPSQADNGSLYFKNFKSLPIPDETLDLISDEKLIKLFSKVGFGSRKNLLGKSEAQKLATAISDAKRNSTMMGKNPRRDRLEGILSDFIAYSSEEDEIFKNYFDESVEGRKYLDSYLDKHKTKLIEEKFKDLDKNFSEKQKELSEKLDLLKEEYSLKKQNLENEITDKKQKYLLEIENLKQESEEKIKSLAVQEITEKEKQLRSDIHLLEEQYGELYNLQKIDNEYKKLVIKKELLSEEIEKINKEKENTTKIIEQQRYVLQSPEIVNKAVEFDTLQKLLSKQNVSEEAIHTSHKAQDEDIIVSEYDLSVETKEEYITYITNRFNEKKSGCMLSEIDIANILLSLSQSFLTVFSGSPGVGKTSSAFKIAEALGIKCSSNFLNITVGRAWVSSRDLLGFYNPLRDNYQSARTGLYPFLLQDSQFLKLILLDEANLSSLEHYWSDFLTMCDLHDQNTTIDTGIPDIEKKYLEVKDNIRFIATINNDGTTERLSPRLIDRSPIIYFDHINFEASSKILDYFTGAIKSEHFLEHFGRSNHSASLNTQQKHILDEIISVLSSDDFKAPKIRISPRKLNNIQHYCQAANDLEGIFVDSSQPMDFAISQHVLPLVDGFGLEYKKRLLKLKEVLQSKSLKKSTLILDHIIKSGEYHSDSYSFF